MMTLDQSEIENHEEFIGFLIKAGWSREEAEKEWDSIQKDEESGL
jgi:hypothetical protein